MMSVGVVVPTLCEVLNLLSIFRNISTFAFELQYRCCKKRVSQVSAQHLRLNFSGKRLSEFHPAAQFIVS